MGYEKTNWADGDYITAERLNKAESAIDGMPQCYIIKAIPDDVDGELTLDRTLDELRHDLYDVENDCHKPVMTFLEAPFGLVPCRVVVYAWGDGREDILDGCSVSIYYLSLESTEVELMRISVTEINGEEVVAINKIADLYTAP